MCLFRLSISANDLILCYKITSVGVKDTSSEAKAKAKDLTLKANANGIKIPSLC